MEEIVLAECTESEEENFNKLGNNYNNGVWSPKLEEIEELYKIIKTKKTIELEWKCLGRRDPNQGIEESALESKSMNQLSSAVKDLESDDFAFDGEEDAPTSIKSTKTGPMFKSKTSTNKRMTTTLAGVLSNMERHRIIDRQGGENNKGTNSNQNTEEL